MVLQDGGKHLSLRLYVFFVCFLFVCFFCFPALGVVSADSESVVKEWGGRGKRRLIIGRQVKILGLTTFFFLSLPQRGYLACDHSLVGLPSASVGLCV